MRLATPLLAVALAVALPASATASTRSCGKVNSGFEYGIQANGVGCATAKALARAWHHQAVDQTKGPYGPRQVSGWACRSRSAGDVEHVRVTCRRRTSWVRFVAGP